MHQSTQHNAAEQLQIANLYIFTIYVDSELYQVVVSIWLRTFHSETPIDHYSLFCFYFGSWLNGLAACNCCNDLVAKVVGFLPFRNCLKLLNPLSRVIELLYSFSVSYRSKAVLSSSPYEKYDQLWQYHDVSYGKRPHSHLADSSPNEMEIS